MQLPSGVSVLAYASLVEMGLGLIFIIIVVVVASIQGASKRHDVVVRNNVPRCPKCNRQVSYRREYRRSCGYKFVSYGKRDE